MDGGTRESDMGGWGRQLLAAALACSAASAWAQATSADPPPVPPAEPAAAVAVPAPEAPAVAPAPPAESPAVTPAPQAESPPVAPPAPPEAPAAPAAAAPAPPPAPAPRPVRVIPDTGARYGDLSIPLTLSPALLRVLLTGATVERPLAAGGALRWRQEAQGRVVATSFTLQGLPLDETGAWRIDEEGRYCFSLAWLAREEENWCHHVVKSDEGYFLIGGAKPDDPVQRIYIDGR
jgi:hypothetical protein